MTSVVEQFFKYLLAILVSSFMKSFWLKSLAIFLLGFVNGFKS